MRVSASNMANVTSSLANLTRDHDVMTPLDVAHAAAVLNKVAELPSSKFDEVCSGSRPCQLTYGAGGCLDIGAYWCPACEQCAQSRDVMIL